MFLKAIAKFFSGLWKIIVEVFTDAQGRPEIKNILGVPIIVIAVIYGIKSRDWVGFTALSGFGVGLLVGSTVADSLIDSSKLTGN
jgi:hypothetical protein